MKEDVLNAYFLRADSKSPYKGYIGSIENTLEALQGYVDGDIETVKLAPDIVAILNEDGKFLELPINRALIDNEGHVLDILVGNVLVVRVLGEEFVSIREEDLPIIEQHLLPVRLGTNGRGEVIAIEELPEWGGS